MSKKIKIVKGWGGFSNDELDTYQQSMWTENEPTQLAIWKTRDAARQRYEDVRRIEIRILGK